MKYLIIAILIALPFTAMTLDVSAVEAKSEKAAADAVKFRKSLLQLVRSNVGVLNAMAKGKIPVNADTLKKNGARLEQLADMMPDYFKIDTRKFNIKTDAKPELWDNTADFESKIKALKDAAVNLQAASKLTDAGDQKKAIGQVFKSCKSCHDDYKAD